jgi:Resolvase, N terminal domain
MQQPQHLSREGDRRADRPARTSQMLKALAPRDVVTVTRIAGLARSTFHLFAIVKQIVDAKAQFRSWPNRGPTPAPAPGG